MPRSSANQLLTLEWYRCWVSSPLVVVSCESWSDTEYEKKRAFAEWERKQARRRTAEVRQIEIPDLPSIESTMSSPSDGARNRWRAATEFEIPYPRSPDMDDDTECACSGYC